MNEEHHRFDTLSIKNLMMPEQNRPVRRRYCGWTKMWWADESKVGISQTTYRREECGLLGCKTVYLGHSQNFRRNRSPPTSGLKNKKTRNLYNEWASWVCSSKISGSLRTARVMTQNISHFLITAGSNLNPAQPYRSNSCQRLFVRTPALAWAGTSTLIGRRASRRQERPCQLQWGFWGRC
jgi:hypothetical protein